MNIRELRGDFAVTWTDWRVFQAATDVLFGWNGRRVVCREPSIDPLQQVP